MKTKICETCQTTFTPRGGAGRFCGYACYYRSLEVKTSRPCSVCGSDVYRKASVMFKKDISCSRVCLLELRRRQLLGNTICAGEKSPRWKGGVSLNNGRMQVTPVGSKRKYRSRHIVGGILGRALLGREVVHHIDKNTLNDSPGNLFVFRHQAAHKRWHDFLRRHSTVNASVLISNLQTV